MFFAQKELIYGDRIEIVGDDAFHIARSLRMAVGDGISVADGEGTVFECTLSEIRDERCVCDIVSSSPAKTESPMEITLYMAYPKGDKLEVVIQKAVELGAHRIVPFESERCIKKPSADKLDKKLERLNRIAKEAAKQCGRARMPEVLAPLSFDAMVKAAAESELPLFCYEGESARSLAEVLRGFSEPPRTVSVTVGCEGGFSAREANAAISGGLISVGLGPRILRCETAPSYALSALSYHFEI
jgi:16S rRNA (uracil1498-N3)-methyltransferase